jgi:hypothetical protein
MNLNSRGRVHFNFVYLDFNIRAEYSSSKIILIDQSTFHLLVAALRIILQTKVANVTYNNREK